jgi:hypothetical protein
LQLAAIWSPDRSSPISRSARNRERHFDTMFRDTPTSWATSPIVPPSALRSTILARNANACDVFRRRAHPASTARSSSDTTTGSTFGLGITTLYRPAPNY